MPDLNRYRPPTNETEGPSSSLQSSALAGFQEGLQAGFARTNYRSTDSSFATPSISDHSTVAHTHALHSYQHPSGRAQCFKPLSSVVPEDVDAEDNEFEFVRQLPSPPPSQFDQNVESDISSSTATSTSSATSSSSMGTSFDWHETSLRRQVAKLSIDYTDIDLTQTEPPSVFGLRRRIIAAALDHVSTSTSAITRNEPSSGGVNRLEESGLSDFLAVQPSTSQGKGKILRKKLSFGVKKTRGSKTIHDPMPRDTCACFHSESTNRTKSSSIHTTTSSHETMLRRDKELAERESHFDLVVLSRLETAELKMLVYTESRQGSWVVKGPADPTARILEEPPPLVFSPWDCQIDSRAIIERKKLRSFIELSDTICSIRCNACRFSQRQGRCEACSGNGAVTATYVVCVTLRQTSFLPLAMPTRHQSGKHQDAFRSYLTKTTKAMSHVDVLRMRSLEAVRSCALRVGRVHHREHDARLLVAKATLERRSCNNVAVINRENGIFRCFDITDGGLIRGRLVEEESRIVETIELADALRELPVTVVVQPEGMYRFVNLELVDMASSKALSFVVQESRSPSIRTAGSSTDESYSPSALSFFQRANNGQQSNRNRYGGDSSRDSHTFRGSMNEQVNSSAHSSVVIHTINNDGKANGSPSNWQLPSLNMMPTGSPTPSFLSFASAKDTLEPSLLALSAPKKPWTSNNNGNSSNDSFKSGRASPASTASDFESFKSFGTYATAKRGDSSNRTHQQRQKRF
ncbi:uncharacterized protein MEPE_06578 [Melanopsichium pennsylvanicum]|uniref:Uncharacterized protein n=2 Tax=Melanopsichium pennsylvanicum TaxID=63383 RepID=A0AAJ4XTR1_9BASI|nr:hypothetical protein BN887_02324 [Melanopsichium pennsylvanicum 4]SNX87867.1 uncharacterized protein MEPE_06578 [Melanopsichium pennsylvanicum]